MQEPEDEGSGDLQEVCRVPVSCSGVPHSTPSLHSVWWPSGPFHPLPSPWASVRAFLAQSLTWLAMLI